MATHSFGIMQEDPAHGERYDSYEPEKYHCIMMDDGLVEDIDRAWNELDFYWHTRSVPGKGLAYCGVTLIPPEMLDACIAGIERMEDVAPLKQLLLRAKAEHRFVIHYGV